MAVTVPTRQVRMSGSQAAQAWPRVSVVMVVRNEMKYIEQSLAAVLAQDYPADRLEVIIADGLSEDGTRAYLDSIQASFQNVIILANPPRIVSTGLNSAIDLSQGDILVRVDGHTVIAPDYVRQCVNELARTKADNVGGKMTSVGEGSFGQAVALATSSPFGVGGARFHYSEQEEWVDTVYMGAWRREVFAQGGLFDEELVRDQDDEFNYRLRARGGRILLSPFIKSTYTVRSNAGALWRQYFQYGFWKVRVLQKHPRQMRLRQFAPPLLAAVLLGGLLFAFTSWLGLAAFAVIGGVYLLANLIASFVVASQHGWRYLKLLPGVFASLHLGYGLGFLWGLVRFWNRWGDRLGQVRPLSTANARSR